MPTYEFQCDGCGARAEQVFSIMEMPDSVACSCGRLAGRVLSSNANVFVKNREYVFDRAKNVRSFARDFGVSDQKHHENYRKKFEGIKQRQKALRTSRHKDDIQWLGGMPGEMVDSIGQHEGDKEAVYKDPIAFLKKTGTYAGD